MKKLFGSRDEPGREPAVTPPRLRLQIELALRVGRLVVVGGWSNQALDLRLRADGIDQPVELQPVVRPDVDAAGMGRSLPGQPAGFALVARDVPETAGLSLVWPATAALSAGEQALAPEIFEPGMRARLGVLGGAVLPLIQALAAQLSFEERLEILAEVPTAIGAPAGMSGSLEKLFVELVGDRGVAMGWLHAAEDLMIWLDSDDGPAVSLAGAFRVPRSDVTQLMMGAAGGGLGVEPGFIVALPRVRPGSVWRLKVLGRHGVHELGRVEAEGLPDQPLEAFKTLCACHTPLERMAERIRCIDAALIQPLIDQRQRALQALPVQVHDVGLQPERPLVSVIIPQYGRDDFIEPQLLKFAEDAWLRRHAEIVFVIDDPRMLEPFRARAHLLGELTGMGFRWVWGGANRGFSGANNLGSAQARGALLLFLNSDVFPLAPGWLPPLVDVLARHPEVGAVAPRLLHVDGSIQHAGMQFKHLEALDIWSNQHPGKGLAPRFDPLQRLSRVPAATGACLLMRADDLAALGGWDTGYLVGDFEDSDLAFKLRARGQCVAYQPAVALTHLERQSFKGLGENDLRTRVVLYNAVRHERRWARELAAAALEPACALDAAEGPA